MKYKLAVCCSLILVLFSKRGSKRFAEQERGTEKEVILTNIQKAGFFMTRQ
jgi:hypothetical protein